jgi:hypothetical protein
MAPFQVSNFEIVSLVRRDISFVKGIELLKKNAALSAVVLLFCAGGDY